MMDQFEQRSPKNLADFLPGFDTCSLNDPDDDFLECSVKWDTVKLAADEFKTLVTKTEDCLGPKNFVETDLAGSVQDYAIFESNSNTESMQVGHFLDLNIVTARIIQK